jgi:hypothetical protein
MIQWKMSLVVATVRSPVEFLADRLLANNPENLQATMLTFSG